MHPPSPLSPQGQYEIREQLGLPGDKPGHSTSDNSSLYAAWLIIGVALLALLGA
jgi:hypothetical protein